MGHGEDLHNRVTIGTDIICHHFRTVATHRPPFVISSVVEKSHEISPLRFASVEMTEWGCSRFSRDDKAVVLVMPL